MAHRNSTLILLLYRHALRVAEAIDLQWADFELDGPNHRLHVRRVKAGVASVHPLTGREARALRRLRREQAARGHAGPWVFMTERGGPLTKRTVHTIVQQAGRDAGLAFDAHPHMLRHACGYKLANEGKDTRSLQAYMGHANIQHTTRYTELAADRFRGWWRD
jgi:site-specific recombinase XerD